MQSTTLFAFRATSFIEDNIILCPLIENDVIDDAAFITKWKGHFTNSNSTYKDEKAYCEENGISFVTDSTNLSDEYTRNFIRHQIISKMQKKKLLMILHSNFLELMI